MAAPAAAASASAAAATATPATINLRELLSVCLSLSESAGEAIRAIFDSGKLGVVDKDAAGASADAEFGSVSDPQTLADLDSQRIILGNLLRVYGAGLGVVGEEGELEASSGEGALFRDARKDLLDSTVFPEELLSLPSSELTVWVDPLDGTKEFTLGVITTTRSHFSPELKALLEKMKPDAIIRCGGAGSKGLLVLSGEADAYLYPQGGTKRWDSCAIDACIKAAGGRFTDQYGDEIVYDAKLPHENVTGLLATLRDHDAYVMPKPSAQASEEAKKANL